SIATREPMHSPRVSAQWQMNRAPPSSATSAMWSGDRNPAGGECSVVNETISPVPSRSTGVIATGSRGQKGAGGATVSPHAGQREPWIVSIIATTPRDRDIPWVARDEVRPGSVSRHKATRLHTSCLVPSWRLEDRHPVVRCEPADRLRERDMRLHLPPLSAPRELPHALDDLREPRRRERVATRLEAARRVHRQPAVERGLAVERRAAGLPRRHQAEVLERHQLEDRERVVQLGHVHALGTDTRHRERRARRRSGGPEARERIAVAERERVHPLPDAGDSYRRAV